MTKYNLYTKFYNEKIGKCVTNTTNCKWYSALLTTYKNKALGHYIKKADMNQYKLEKEKETLETLYISKPTMSTAENLEIYEDLVTKAANVNNPKYDMIFIWDRLDYYVDETNQQNQLYFDRMRRVEFRPWFFHSTTSSLRQALVEEEKLMDMFGKENVMLVKEVPLDQYIDIV